MPVYLKDGQVLLVDDTVAVDEACCCPCNCPIDGDPIFITFVGLLSCGCIAGTKLDVSSIEGLTIMLEWVSPGTWQGSQCCVVQRDCSNIFILQDPVDITVTCDSVDNSVTVEVTNRFEGTIFTGSGQMCEHVPNDRNCPDPFIFIGGGYALVTPT